MKTKITIAKGDGIGPEIMDATLAILFAAGAQIDLEEIEVGEKVYLAGNTAGISKESWDVIHGNNFSLHEEKMKDPNEVEDLKCVKIAFRPHSINAFKGHFKPIRRSNKTDLCGSGSI